MRGQFGVSPLVQPSRPDQLSRLGDINRDSWPDLVVGNDGADGTLPE